jgi:AcrR family transcriptional regulator
MARKRKARPASAAQTARPEKSREGSSREKTIEAFLELLAEKRFEQISLAEIASRAGVSLADMRADFGSTLAILAAHIKDIDRAVLADVDAGMAEEPARERLFDVLMRRLELLEPHKEAVRSLMRSATFNPGLALAFNAMAVHSQQWMLTAANISAAGPIGQIRAQGLALLFANVLRTWIDDDEKGLSRTLAALDRALASGQRWVGLMDDICSIPSRICRVAKPLRKRGRSSKREGDEPLAA